MGTAPTKDYMALQSAHAFRVGHTALVRLIRAVTLHSAHALRKTVYHKYYFTTLVRTQGQTGWSGADPTGGCRVQHPHVTSKQTFCAPRPAAFCRGKMLKHVVMSCDSHAFNQHVHRSLQLLVSAEHNSYSHLSLTGAIHCT
eukprot:1155210-Pelagomonas_calceolata.AAC.4